MHDKILSGLEWAKPWWHTISRMIECIMLSGIISALFHAGDLLKFLLETKSIWIYNGNCNCTGLFFMPKWNTLNAYSIYIIIISVYYESLIIHHWCTNLVSYRNKHYTYFQHEPPSAMHTGGFILSSSHQIVLTKKESPSHGPTHGQMCKHTCTDGLKLGFLILWCSTVCTCIMAHR